MVYENWAKKVLEKASLEKKDLWRGQLKRLFDPQHPEHTFFRGVTTNPPLSLGAVKDKPFSGLILSKNSSGRIPTRGSSRFSG